MEPPTRARNRGEVRDPWQDPFPMKARVARGGFNDRKFRNCTYMTLAGYQSWALEDQVPGRNQD